jgi:hypothetical protein
MKTSEKGATEMIERQTGRTTEDMKGAPHGAIYVWHNRKLRYPRLLANKLNRLDLKIMCPCEADRKCRGTILPVVLDHAAVDVVSEMVLDRAMQTIREEEPER